MLCVLIQKLNIRYWVRSPTELGHPERRRLYKAPKVRGGKVRLGKVRLWCKVSTGKQLSSSVNSIKKITKKIQRTYRLSAYSDSINIDSENQKFSDSMQPNSVKVHGSISNLVDFILIETVF